VSKETVTNVAASVRQKLLNRARNDHRPFQELLQYFAMERFLYRLSCSNHSDKFVLKGALMLRICVLMTIGQPWILICWEEPVMINQP